MKFNILLAIGIAATAAAHAQVFKTVGVYDAPTHPNKPDVFMPSVAFYPGFTNLVWSAFPANRGGVINFDATHSSPWNVAGIPVWKAHYGAGGVQVCTVAFGYPVVVANMVGQPWTPISGSPNGPGALTSAGISPILVKLSAPVPIRRMGLTVLQRVGVPQKVVVNFMEAGGAVNSQSFLVPAGFAGIMSARDTFVGANAVGAGGFVAVEVRSLHANTGVLLAPAIDDLAFTH